MRRFLSISFLALALMIGATGVASSAHAADCTTAGGSCTTVGGGTGTCVQTEVGFACSVSGAQEGVTAAQTAAATAQAAAAAQTPTAGNSSPADGYNSVMQWIMSIFAWLVGVAALTLDTAVFYTVVTMGDYVHKLTAVGVAWRILRDIGNIMLIFGFLAIGISIILNTERLGYGKKMLPMLLVAAVFLNFSLFFTEAIIDTGNLFATQFYKQINGGNMPTAAFTASATVKNEGISNKLMAQLGLASLYNVNDGKVNTQIFKGSNPSIIGFLGILLFIITAFVMFSLAFILIARFVILIFLIILAPIGFAGLAVPQLAKKAGQWWAKLFQQTITAPVLLLLLYVALAVITDAQFLTGFNPTGGTWLGYLNSTDLSGFGGVLLSFLVAMGLLLTVTISAKSLSAFGADKATALAGKLTFGATALGASSLLGGTSRLLRYGVQNKLPDNRYTRAASRVLRAGEGARMDLRAIPGVSTGLASAGVGGPVGKSAAGRVKQGVEYMKKTGQESDQQNRQETVVPRLNTAVQSALQTGDYKQVGSILSSMSDKDLETSAAHKALVNNPAAVALLSQTRFDKLQSSEVLTAAQKAALAQARKDGDNPDHAQSRFSTLATSTYGATLPGTTTPHPFAGQTRGQALVGGMNTATRGKLAGNVLTTPPPTGAPAGTPPTPRNTILDNLNGSDFDAVRREGQLTPAEKVAVGDYILNIITTPRPLGAVIPPRDASIIAASAAPAFKVYYNIP